MAVQDALTDRAQELFTGEPEVLHVGPYHSLRKVALASGMPRQVAIQAIALAERALETVKDPVIAMIRRYLERHAREASRLLVCVTEGQCRMPVGTAFIPDESRITLGLPFQAPRPRLERPIPHLIVFNGGPDPVADFGARLPVEVQAIGWTVDFLTAAVSYAAYELTEDWIAANTRLMQARERSDELFDRYARIVPTLRLNSGFFRIYTSSLASVVSVAVTPGYESEARAMGMAEIEAAGRETRDVVRALRLDAGGLLEFGRRTTAQMAETMRRAKALPSPH